MSIPISKYAVLFDIDGTLLGSGGAGSHAFYETFREDFGISDPVDGVPFAGRSDRAIAYDLMKLNSVEPSEENWQRFQHTYTSRLANSLRVNDGRVLPGVQELLSKIERLDYVTLGLITGNMEAGAKAKLVHYGLVERFYFGGYGDHHTDRDDIARAALDAAHRHLETLHEGQEATLHGAMVIGDTQHDITCAHAIGAYAVGVATGSASLDELQAAGADLVLEDLSEPEQLLAEIHAARPD